ncbi:MAG: TonB-dependent receptor [Alphaproteobacteria bacterium]|nr:TonB-dependent receptor [Alphaproteobacteria bacterium]
MSTKRLSRRFLRSALMTGVAAAAAAPAFAQDEAEDTIIVTGSRLNQANLNSSSPVFQVEAGEVDTRGAARIEDLLNILPQALPSQTSELANGATGTSTLDLRGLGSQRTLVLVDGKRLPYGLGNGTGVGANLDFIPAQLVERVDIVTGGASAVYGSDALSGVANFIMRRDFEGLELDGQVGFFQDGNGNDFANQLNANFGVPIPDAALDGRGVNVSAIFGANTADGRGNVTAFIQYQDQNEVRQGARDYSACAYGIGGFADPRALQGVACAGSSTFRRLGVGNANGDLFVADDGSLVPFTGAPDQLFNFAPDNFLQRNNERFNLTAMARYEVAPNVEAFLDLGFVENVTDSQIAFSGTFGREFQINCDNPFLDAAHPAGGTLRDTFFGCTPAQVAAGEDVRFAGPTGTLYRNVGGDPRSSFIGIQTFRTVGGLRGVIDERWNWEVFGQFSRTNLTTESSNDLNFARVQDGFFAVDDGMGNVVCRSGNAGCAPINLFSQASLPLDQSRALQGTGIVRGVTEQIVLGGNIGGDLGFGTPWTENNVQALVGVEYRRDSLDRRPDEISRIPSGLGLTGTGGATLPVAGEVEVAEIYMEASIPLVQDRPFFEDLTINGAFRYSDYSTDGNGIQNSFSTETFAAGLAWSPVSDIRFRAQFQRAVRAPNVFELYTGQNTGLFNQQEPCRPGTTFTAAQCAFTGLPAAQYNVISDNPAGQLNSVTGGNPLLVAESSDTYTFGVVLQPRWIDGLAIAVDYYDISIDDAISTVPPATALGQCLTTGAAQFCDLIVRDLDGSLWSSNTPPAGSPFQFAGVQATNANISNLATRGIDVSANYGFDLDQIGIGGMGSMNFNYVSTFLLEQSSIPVPGVTSVIECKGLYRGSPGCGGPQAEYRHRFLATWQSPYNVDVTATWRYTSGVDVNRAVPQTLIDAQLDSANYLDLAVQWYLKENLTMRAGVQNVMGRDPELSQEAGTAPGNGDTFPAFYDPLGRFIFVGFNWSL